VLVQEIKTFIQLTDGYEEHSDVSGDNAFLRRALKKYYQQEGLPTCDDINEMIFFRNPQYPGGFIPKGKTNIMSHIQTAFLRFGLVMDGTGQDVDGVRDGKCWRFAWLSFAFRFMCLTQPVMTESLLFGSYF
jgi:hypothetical protein